MNRLQSYLPYLDELQRHVFRLKHDYLLEAGNKLLQHNYNRRVETSVSIHVRLTDFSDWVLRDLPVISRGFLTKAMSHFNQKYSVSDIKIFILSSSEK